MAYTLYRFFRWMSSTCAQITALVGFSFLLTYIFVLYKPTPGPGVLQKIGWQSWDVVDVTQASSASQTKPPGDTGDSPSEDEVDWWNVTTVEQKVDSASLPLDEWAPLLPHDTGLSEIVITRCVIDPAFSNVCEPHSTSEQDAIKGKWVRVERNLNIQSGVWHLNVYYRRTRRRDINLITDLLLLPEGELPFDADASSWHRVSRSIRDGVLRTPPLYLWYRLGKTSSQMTAQERQEQIITELDVLYGADIPWYGFEKLEPPTTPEQEGRIEGTWLTYRRGVKVPPRAPPLHFTHDGKFKVLQIADLHFSVAPGKCRDTLLSPCKHSDNLTSSLLERTLDVEKPSLVVFTGDQLNGQDTSWDPKSVLAKFARAVTDRGIPWAAVFGNHDDDIGASRREQMRLMQGLPYSLVEPGPKDVRGVGNYVLKVMSADASKMHLLTLYFLDSGSYSKGIIDWFSGFFLPTEYDYIHQNQINWFLQQSGSISPIARPFTPDGGKDFGNIWARQNNQLTPQTKLAKPNALMFFHIPLQESYADADVDTRTNLRLDVGIHGLETKGSATKNGGFFEKGLLKAMESDHAAGGNAHEVKVVGNGHCHVTENCRRVKGVWLCFGGGGSYSGYGRIGFDRRFRVYDISDYGETIRTYKRTEHDEIIDDLILAGRGAAPL